MLSVLALTLAGLAAAEGNVVVSTTPIAVTVGLGAIAATSVTVRNTGDGPLTLRLRDTGSGTGGPAVTPAILASYPVTEWVDASGMAEISGFFCDGINLWRYSFSRHQMIATRLETGVTVRAVTLAGSESLMWLPASDGTSVWLGEWGAATRRQVYQYNLATGAKVTTITFPDKLTTQAWNPELGYAPATDRVIGINSWLGFSCVPGQSSYQTEPQFQTSTGSLGFAVYDGDIWYTKAGGSKTALGRRDLITGAIDATYDILPATSVAEAVYGMTADGWGRMLVYAAPIRGKRLIYHLDSGVRGWMTCAEATTAATTIPAGGSQTFTIRMAADHAGVGTHASMLLVDSDDPDQPRLTIPVSFVVENRLADPPVVRADVVAATWDATLSVAAPGVLANDDGAGLAVSLVGSVDHGVLTVQADGSFTYDATDGYVGTDSFTYRVTDSQGRTSATATVTIAVDHAPIPKIKVEPTSISATITSSGTATVTMDIANVGYGTLLVGIHDPGTGGTPGAVIRERAIATPLVTNGGFQSLAVAGPSVWVFDSMVDKTIVRRLDMADASGAVLDTVVPGLEHDVRSIAWDGSHLWVMEYRQYGPKGESIEAPMTLAVIDPVTDTRIQTLTLPYGYEYLLAYDGAGHMWAVAMGPAYASYRIDTTTYAMTAKPPMVSTYTRTALGWYDGSLWSKSAGTVHRYNPETGALVSGSSFTWTGSDDYALFQGLGVLGFGRFLITSGNEFDPVLRVIDSGMRGWMQSPTTSLSVGRQSSQTMTVTLLGSVAGVGTHSTVLRFLSNDATDPVVTIPILLTVSSSGTANQPPMITTPAGASATIAVLP
jgi:hypothetical protein